MSVAYMSTVARALNGAGLTKFYGPVISKSSSILHKGVT